MDSLFFRQEHVMIRDMVRDFADTQIMPIARSLDPVSYTHLTLPTKA